MAASVRSANNPLPQKAPPEIAGGPPPDIEGLGNVRDREPKTVEEANTEYDKILEEINAAKAANALLGVPGIVRAIMKEEPAPANTFTRDTFSTLPTDDSHASKVLRAAANFAGAAQAWAQELAYVEKVKKILLTAEAELGRVTCEKIDAETELKKLVAGE